MPHVLLLDPDVVSRASLCQRIERVQLRQQRRPPNLPSRPLARNGSERRAGDIMIETEQRRDGGPAVGALEGEVARRQLVENGL